MDINSLELSPCRERRYGTIMEKIVEVFSWGGQEFKCLLHTDSNSDKMIRVPKRIVNLDRNFDLLTCRLYKRNVGVIFDIDGCVYSFGCNRNGRFGHGDDKDAAKPKIVALTARKDCASIFCATYSLSE